MAHGRDKPHGQVLLSELRVYLEDSSIWGILGVYVCLGNGELCGGYDKALGLDHREALQSHKKTEAIAGI